MYCIKLDEENCISLLVKDNINGFYNRNLIIDVLIIPSDIWASYQFILQLAVDRYLYTEDVIRATG